MSGSRTDSRFGFGLGLVLVFVGVAAIPWPAGTSTISVSTGPAATRSGAVSLPIHVGTVSGVYPSVLECPAVATCYLAGNPPIVSANGSDAMTVTHDVGKTWLQGGPFLSTSLTCVSAQVCAGATDNGGHSRFHETLDGGKTWASRSLPHFTNVLSCTTATHCVSAPSSTGRVDITRNGGRTWTSAHLPSNFATFQAFGLQCFANGWCDAIGNFLNQEPGSSKPIPGRPFVGSTAAVYSADGGLHWHKGATPSKFHIYTNLSCGTSMDCMVLGADGRSPAIATQDGGRTWHPVANPGGSVARKGFAWVACVGQSECWMEAGQDHGATLGVVESTNLGQSWHLLKAPSSIGAGGTLACATATACYATADTAQPPASPTSATTMAPQLSGTSLFVSW